MGKLRVIKTGPLASIQDLGRLGYRKYGIPQSGAMDLKMMRAANQMVGNPKDHPAIEFALSGIKLEAMEESYVCVLGSQLMVNGKITNTTTAHLTPGDLIEAKLPDGVYAYLAIAGRIQSKEDFGSVSTYTPAKFGGLNGRNLQEGDELISGKSNILSHNADEFKRSEEAPSIIRIMRGPEWDLLKELPEMKMFKIDPSSNRMGIRLIGEPLDCDYQEIASSAVVPGTIQLPSDGQPIVLMKDCQTTGGYPRIGKVVEEDLGKLAQVRFSSIIKFQMI